MACTSGCQFHPQNKSGMHLKMRSQMLWPSSLDTLVTATVSLYTVMKVLFSLPSWHCTLPKFQAEIWQLSNVLMRFVDFGSIYRHQCERLCGFGGSALLFLGATGGWQMQI